MNNPVPSRSRAVLAALLVVSLLAAPRPVLAQPCDADTEARLAFIETNLEEGQARERLWWRSWMAIFSIGVVYSVTGGILEDNNEHAAASYVTAGKSALGIAQLLLRPHVGRHGAAPIRALPKGSPEQCTARLEFAEETMAEAAKAASMRWDWKTHLSSLILNLGAGIAIAEGADEPGRGWQDFAVSEISSEAHIWTHPTRAAGDWDSYRQRFGGPSAAALAPDWQFVARPGGVGVLWRF